MAQVRNVCITVNNYSDDVIERLRSNDQISYAVIGKEMGENGTPHLQGYLEFVASKKFSTVKKLIPTAHIEKRRGTAQQAADYCKKDEDYVEWGVISRQGKRSDLDDVVAEIQKKRPLSEIACEFPVQFVKFHKGLQALANYHIPERNWETHVEVFYGATGTGKSRRAHEEMPDAWVRGPENGTWFDGYQGQDDVIFEEFRGDLKFSFLLQLLDRYKCQVPIKGGFVQWKPRRLIIISPFPPDQWYSNIEDKQQLYRRINKITHFPNTPFTTYTPTP